MQAIKRIITLLLISSISAAHADILSENLQSIDNQRAQVEYCLGLGLKEKGKIDTTRLKNKLKPLLQHKNDGVRLSYYLLLADATSMVFDGVNPTTDHYFEKALTIAKKSERDEYLFITLTRAGYYNFVYREISKALPYFLSSSKLVEQVDLKKIPLAASHLQYIANFFGYIGESKKAQEYYKMALKYVPVLSRRAIDLTNAIGVYYYRDSLYNDAEQYYQKALKTAEATKDSVWIGILKGNIGNIQLVKGDTAQAIRLSESNVASSIQYGEYKDAMRTLLGLAEIAVSQGKWDKAKKYIARAEIYFQAKPYFVPYKTNAYRLKARVAEAQGDPVQAVQYLNTFIKYNDALQLEKDTERLQKTLWKWESERYESALLEANEKRRQDRIRGISVGLILTLSFLCVTLLIHRSRQRIRLKSIKLEKEQLALILEKQQLDEELLQSKQNMENFLVRIRENENVIQRLEDDLYNAQLQQQKHNVVAIQNSLNQMLESHIMTDERWYRFKTLFEGSNPGFFDELTFRYPNISESNLRLLTLLKLNLSNQSIAHLLGISLDGVKKAKQRLRKKIDYAMD
ncbi:MULTISPECIES: tetratricopeptide repeat protein [Sphingobacterium]|nr:MULTISPECIES: hypothetical protein [unclassified Sphingobacterium]